MGLGGQYPVSYKDFWEYDPATNAWTQKADFGGSGRLYAARFTTNGKGYVGTGQSGTYPNYTYYKDFWEYDPISNNWTQKRTLEALPGMGLLASL
jgi:N-acetylneuraminic acid mutarotase